MDLEILLLGTLVAGELGAMRLQYLKLSHYSIEKQNDARIISWLPERTTSIYETPKYLGELLARPGTFAGQWLYDKKHP